MSDEIVTVDWEDDWEIGDHFHEYGECYAEGEPSTCEVAIARIDGEVYASLGCIDDADDEYRAEIERELVDEARCNWGREYLRGLAGWIGLP